MCGITGIFHCIEKKEVDFAVLKKMQESLSHRGPDETGLFTEPGIGLAHLRLSIIDLKSGQQPMFNQDKSIGVVFNGEIYNFREIRRELMDLGFNFQTHSDTEVLIHGYQAWREGLLDKLRGMFAFCLWDKKKDALFLARDRLGIKPLYYAFLPTGEFIFGSELKALVAHPAFEKKLRLDSVMDYFALGYVPDPKTIYQSAHKLNPACYLKVQKGQHEAIQVPYWALKRSDTFITDPIEAMETLREKVKEAVSIRLLSEVPLGAFLSGGVDSSVVVSTMAELLERPVTTCQIAFQEKNFDESLYGQLVAKRFHTHHYQEKVPIYEANLLDQLQDIYDEPFADSSSLPTLRVCQSAKKHVTVTLSGDGGDEIFAGYRRYRGHLFEEKIRNTLPLGLRRLVFGPLAALYPSLAKGPRFLRAKATLKMLNYSTVEGYFNNVCLFKDNERNKLLTDSFCRELDGYHPSSVFEAHASKAPTDDPLSLVQYLDLKTYLPGDILTKVDRASMRFGLEVRVPLLDHKLVEWAWMLSSSLKLKDGIGKYILKKAYESKLPNNILYRKKQGFAVPLKDWFRGPLKQRALDLTKSQGLIESNIVNMGYVAQLVNAHMSHQSDHSAQIWTLCMFEDFITKMMFHRKEDDAYARVACAGS